MSAKSKFLKIVQKAHSIFRYVEDNFQYGVTEDWRIPQIDHDGFLYGDCDDFACYVFDRGRAEGLSMRVIVLLLPVGGKWMGHAVVYCEDCNLIGDNMHREPYKPGFLKDVRYISMSGVNNLGPGNWFKVTKAL